MNTITIRRLDDMHCHFRLHVILNIVLPYTAQYASRGIAMPNIRPNAILTGNDVIWYRNQITQSLNDRYPFEPLMTIEIRDNTTPQIVTGAHEAGAIAGKAYPLEVTTNSNEGLQDFFSSGISETFCTMQDIGMPLLLHGELGQRRTMVTGRELAFLPTLVKLTENFPKLKIVLEHLSTRVAVDTVLRLGNNVAATITAHHLCLTLNDVIGDGIQPHHCCMPIPKDYDDRDALIKAATSGNPKFFLGSDSAPHLRSRKECSKGSCGIFTAPVLPQVLAEVFEDADSLNRLEDFTSRFGAEFYGLPLNEGTITLSKSEQRVPDSIRGIVPFRAGTKLRWRLT